jgi:hypothetical protein
LFLSIGVSSGGEGGGQGRKGGEEMTQSLYAHINQRKKIKKKKSIGVRMFGFILQLMWPHCVPPLCGFPPPGQGSLEAHLD